ncbi:hypothetical protein AWB65_04196 [Caballeronia humi]|uniref:Uncharacterized protein n=2 Tax=Caballeronia humi TaxID=326474 RepID=A0A158I5P2_9BURK|nr:hypothetical protein AWB65_04196 [Caballeronia humi]
MPSAPRLNLSSSRNDATPPPRASGDTVDPSAVQARALQFLREVLEKTENVGDRFAEEARRIHYNEAPSRNIRGVTTPEDAHALLEEGIDVMPLPVPAALKEPLQ